MKRKYVVLIAVILASLLLIGLIVVSNLRSSSYDQQQMFTCCDLPPESSQNPQSMTKTQNPEPSPKQAMAKGRYTTYGNENRSASGFDTNVIFFHAPWCPECRAFKQAIQADEIPNGVQILEADYDSSTDLKKQYGITLQSTFVRVDKNGNLQEKWVGYGQDKSLANILVNVQ